MILTNLTGAKFFMTENEAISLIKTKLSKYYAVSATEATKSQVYKAVVMCIRDILLEKRSAFNKKYVEQNGKRVYYLCMEFLLGQSLKNNTYNLGVQNAFDKALKKEFNLSLDSFCL